MRTLPAPKAPVAELGPLALTIDVVPVESGTSVKCDVCGRRPGSSSFETGPDGRTVLLCSACINVLRTKGMGGLRRLARQSGSDVANVLPTGPARVRVLELEP